MRFDTRTSAVLVVAVLLAGCGGSGSGSGSGSATGDDAGSAIQEFYNRLGAEDYAGAMALYNSEVRGMLELPGGEIDDGFMDWARGETKKGKVQEIRVTSESADVESATVEYDVVYADGSTATRSVSLSREDGQWKLGFIDEG